MENLAKFNIGHKDIAKSLYAVWEQLFWQKNESKKGIISATITASSSKGELVLSIIKRHSSMCKSLYFIFYAINCD